jgi:hypothetical protein
MKNLFFALTMLAISSITFGQETKTNFIPSNEISIDMTKLAGRFFNLNISDTTQYADPGFNILYKRYFNCFSLRAGIGIDLYNYDEKIPYRFYDYITSNYIDTSLSVKNNALSYRLKAGAEKSYAFHKKWELLYGIDLVYMNKASKDHEIVTGTYSTTLLYREDKSTIMALSPFAGIKFNISDKFSIFTESYYWLYHINAKKTEKTTFLSTPQAPVEPSESTVKGIFSYFTTPVSIHIAVRF